MTLTLLLDLDDTLLTNNTDISIPKYLHSLSSYMKNYAEPEAFVAALMAGTNAMMGNLDPSQTLEEVFGDIFYTQLNLNPSIAKESLEKFYAEVYPTLQRDTEFRPEAAELIKQAQSNGYKIGIATNPLFPAMAIEHRLAWAGLPIDQFSFPVISSFETFHFTKPHAAYYAEVLARMGWPDGPVVMVGNDLEMDIAGAENLGLANFLISEDESLHATDSVGWLTDVLPWIESQNAESLTPQFNSKESILAVAQSTIAVLDTLFRVNSIPVDWNQSPNEAEWNLTEILCHLRDVTQDINTPRVKHILDSKKSVFVAGVDSDQWAIDRDYKTQNGEQALKDYLTAQKEWATLLSGLTESDWALTANHSIFGPTTVQELLVFSSRHERLHIRQIQQTIAQLQARNHA